MPVFTLHSSILIKIPPCTLIRACTLIRETRVWRHLAASSFSNNNTVTQALSVSPEEHREVLIHFHWRKPNFHYANVKKIWENGEKWNIHWKKKSNTSCVLITSCWNEVLKDKHKLHTVWFSKLETRFQFAEPNCS